MFCEECGAKLDAGSYFCDECGAPVSNSSIINYKAIIEELSKTGYKIINIEDESIQEQLKKTSVSSYDEEIREDINYKNITDTQYINEKQENENIIVDDKPKKSKVFYIGIITGLAVLFIMLIVLIIMIIK